MGHSCFTLYHSRTKREKLRGVIEDGLCNLVYAPLLLGDDYYKYFITYKWPSFGPLITLSIFCLLGTKGGNSLKSTLSSIEFLDDATSSNVVCFLF